MFRGNPESQGYRLSDDELQRLRFAVRFPTALCLPLVAIGLVTGSWPLLLGLAAIGGVAGFTTRHPFDTLWNRVVRRFVAAPELPRNPRPRRHAFKLGTAMLVAVAALFAADQQAAALVLGALLVLACASATVLNFCVPSALLARLEEARG
jgi:hypothetical protein